MSNDLCAISLQFKRQCRGLKQWMSIWVNERLAYYCLVVSLWGSYIIPLRLGVFIFPSSTGAMDLIWLGLGEDQIPDRTDSLLSCSIPSLHYKSLSNNDHLAQPLTYPVIYNLTIWTLKASWTEVNESNSDPWMKKLLLSHKHQQLVANKHQDKNWYCHTRVSVRKHNKWKGREQGKECAF